VFNLLNHSNQPFQDSLRNSNRISRLSYKLIVSYDISITVFAAEGGALAKWSFVFAAITATFRPTTSSRIRLARDFLVCRLLMVTSPLSCILLSGIS